MADEDDSSLWSGRSFRVYREFSANTVLRFTAGKKFRLTAQTLYLTAGSARAVISVGGTEGGTWTAVPTLFPKNGLRNKASAAAVHTGGTITSSTEREVLLANAGAGSQAWNIMSGERVLPAGTYYMTLTVTGTTSGVYGFEFDELDD